MSDEGYFDVRPDLVADDFKANTSEPLTARAGWSAGPGEGTFARLDALVPEGVHLVAFDKEWMIEGGEYAVRIVDGVEEWWEKIDGNWVPRP